MTGFPDDGNKGSAIYKMVDSLIIGYLRKRGYAETEKNMLSESMFFRNRDPSRPILVTTTVNDKHLDDIIETFYYYGRFDAPPELLAMEQQLRDYSNTFTNFVVNYSRSNQDRMRERQLRMISHQQLMSGAAPRPTYGAMNPRRGFSVLGASTMAQGQTMQRHRVSTGTLQYVGLNGDTNPSQENPHIDNGQRPFEQQLLQANQDEMQTDQPNDNIMADNGSSQEINQMIAGANKRKSKPRNEFTLAARAFEGLKDTAQAARDTASWENNTWDFNIDMLPMDPEVTCKLLVDYCNEGYPDNGGDPLQQIHEQMGFQDMEIVQASVTPAAHDTVTVDTPQVEAPQLVQATPVVAQIDSSFVSIAHNTTTVVQVASSEVPMAHSTPAVADDVASPTPAVPFFAPMKIESKKSGAVATDSSSSLLSTASDQTTDPVGAKNEKVVASVSMDELFGDGDPAEVSGSIPQKRNRLEQKDEAKDSTKSKESGQKLDRHSSPLRSRNADPIVNTKVTSQERPPSNGSSSSSQSSAVPRAKSPQKTQSSRARSPSRDASKRPGSPSPRGNTKQDRHRQPERHHHEQERHRRESDDHRNRHGGSRDKKNDSSKERQAARRRSEDERPPSRSGDQPPHGSHKARSPPKKESEKNRSKRPQEKKEEPLPLRSCLSKKSGQPKLSNVEEDVLSNIASNMDNLRKPEKPVDPFPNAPMFGFPIQKKLPQIRIPKLRSLDNDKKKTEEKESKRDLVISNGSPTDASNGLIKGTLSDSRLACVLSAITEKRLESQTSPSTATISQAYDTGEDQPQGYNAYHASMEKSSDTPKSAKRRKLDMRNADKVISRIHHGSS